MSRRQDIAQAVRLDGEWRPATVAMQRDTGDAIVAVDGWSFSLEGGSEMGDTVRMSLQRYQPGQWRTTQTDPRNGEVFETSAHAQAYALNRGALKWYSEFAASKLVEAATQIAELMNAMCRRVERDRELGDILATSYPFGMSLDELACEVIAWRDAMDATIRKPQAPITGLGELTICPLCRKPAHASETDDSGKHAECARKERGIVP